MTLYKQATDGGENPLYDPRKVAVEAIAEHLAEDDSAYADSDEAMRQALRIMAAIEQRHLQIVKA